MDPSFVPYQTFPQRAAHEQAYTAELGTAHIYHDGPGYAHGSPSPHPHHAGSPELHGGPFHFSLSSASGQSASSSNVGSPYSNHATIAPPVKSWVQQHGLGIQQPSIAGDDFGYQYGSFGGSGMDQHEFNFADVQKPVGFVDPSILQPYTVAPNPVQQDFPHSVYPPPQSPALSDMSSERSSKRIKSSQSPYLDGQNTFPYAYAASGRISMSPSSPGSSLSLAKNTCPFADCGKVFKDIKAHMLTHQLERPEKCPITTCDYHVKGFARKYDKNRHTLTHYKGTMVCGFCPGSGSSLEKSFNRADVFKRHLTSVHYVEQVPPNARRKSSNDSSSSNGAASKFASDSTGKCSTCSAMFKNAQDFYEHLDDCVLRLVQQEEPSEAINAKRLAEVEDDRDVHDTLKSHDLPTTTSKRTSFSDDDEEEPQEQDDENDGDYSTGRKSKKSKTSKKSGAAPSKAGRKKRKEYPSSWGCPQEQMKTKKRTLCVFNGRNRLTKDEMGISSEYEVRVNLGAIEPRTGAHQYVTDMDIMSMARAETLHNEHEQKGPWQQ